MPRIHKRVIEIIFSSDYMKRAEEDVLSSKLSVRKSALEHNVKKSTLLSYVNKAKEHGVENTGFSSRFVTTQVFTNDMESSLSSYLKNCSNMSHGLTPKSTRRLAYEFAKKNSIKIPDSWKDSKMAAEDWFTGFMSYQSDLSSRTPKATSLARISSFNPTTVAVFQNHLDSVFKRHHFTASDIYNFDILMKPGSRQFRKIKE